MDDLYRYNYEGDESWRDLAGCNGVDQSIFFPARGESTVAAKKVCATCVVRDECLEYALVNVERSGIWGGKSESERRVLRSQRHKARQDVAVA